MKHHTTLAARLKRSTCYTDLDRVVRNPWKPFPEREWPFGAIELAQFERVGWPG